MNARTIISAGIASGKRYRLLRRPPESILPSTPRPMRRDCHGRLVAALRDSVHPDGEVVDSDVRPWASATFVGARHGVTLILYGTDAASRAADLAQSLPEREFRIPGHIVADLATQIVQADGEIRLILSILTVEAW
jgi:hypothetical protein